ncbi:MAG TPA: hypothetical protein VJ254_00805, partial [Streptosporangiaceae bacterium]|nr:hypothetical protein [Streptosporangiaceae bacterium]
MADFTTGSVLVLAAALSLGGDADQDQTLGSCIPADRDGMASVAHGKAGPMVGWLLDLIDKRGGV